MAQRCIWSAVARASLSCSRANRVCLEREIDVGFAARERARNHQRSSVLIRNSDAARHLKLQLNLVFRKNLARIQAAGVNGFVKGSSSSNMQDDTEAKPAAPALKR